MGPSVKFVSRINGSFSKKIWVYFLFVKTPNRAGGWLREVWQITRFFRIIFVKPSLIYIFILLLTRSQQFWPVSGQMPGSGIWPDFKNDSKDRCQDGTNTWKDKCQDGKMPGFSGGQTNASKDGCQELIFGRTNPRRIARTIFLGGQMPHVLPNLTNATRVT